jgi:hypothetical protein
MAIPLLIFEPLDLPPDIHIILDDNYNYYIFNKITETKSTFFTIQQNDKLECYLLDNFNITNIKVFEHIKYIGNNINTFLWKISDCKYDKRYIKLEIIERLRSIHDETDLLNLREIIRNIKIDGASDIEES